MDFTFTTEQDELRAVVRAFARREVAPLSRQIDSEARMPPELLRRLAEVGLLGAAVPVDAGGGGAGSCELGIMVEELARADFSVAHMPVMAGLVAQIVARAGGGLRDTVLPRLLDGSATVAFALTEPDAGSDANSIRCTATPTESGGFVLHGRKTSISNLRSACGVIVVAKVAGVGDRSISAFYVPIESPGNEVSMFDDLGCRGLARGELNLDGVEVPAEHLIGPIGAAFSLVMHVFDLTRTLIALAAVAAASQSVSEAFEYARQRQSFGAPLLAHQGVAFPLAEHATKLEAARWLCYRTLWLRDQGRDHTVEAAMCKWWAVTTAVEAAHGAMLVHGHSGYTRDLPLEQRLRDVIGMEWGDGTAQIQKLVIARAFGREGGREFA